MSDLSTAYHAAPPAVRDFLRNYTRKHLSCQGPWRIPPLYDTRQYFYTPGQPFTAYTTWDLWKTNYTAQIYYTGSPTPEQPIILTPSFSWTNLPEPIFDLWGDWSRGSQTLLPKQLLVNYPRPYSRGRRHYWTGAPRRRRNL